MQEIIQKISEISKKHRTLWFRGHSNSNYKLNSGLYRINKNLDNVRIAENNMYNYFINLGHFYTGNFFEYREWNTLFMMQHYGLYTRLLDWTSSFATALYFAILDFKSEKDENACIWIIDPVELNSKGPFLYERERDERFDSIGLVTLETLPIRIKNYTNYFNEDIHVRSFAIMPRRSNDRLISQSGYFTIQGTDGIPLEKEFEQYMEKFIYKIELTPDTIEEARNYLKLNGINYYSIYGGIDGLCTYIKNELLQIKLENK